MVNFPFEIPKSLLSYCEQFENQPHKATKKLRKHLKKRGLDPVGYMLLSWFYYLGDDQQKAIETALKAKVFAPGSQYIGLLHYYFSHPKTADAWVPEMAIPTPTKKQQKNYDEPKGSPFKVDLDKLIQSLNKVEKIDTDGSISNVPPDQDLSDTEASADGIVTETLAEIHQRQGKYLEAKQTYQALIDIKPEKKDHYETKIKEIEKHL